MDSNFCATLLCFFVMDDDNVHMIDDSYLLKVAKKP